MTGTAIGIGAARVMDKKERKGSIIRAFIDDSSKRVSGSKGSVREIQMSRKKSEL